MSNLKLDGVFSNVFGKAATASTTRLTEKPSEKMIDLSAYKLIVPHFWVFSSSIQWFSGFSTSQSSLLLQSKKIPGIAAMAYCYQTSKSWCRLLLLFLTMAFISTYL